MRPRIKGATDVLSITAKRDKLLRNAIVNIYSPKAQATGLLHGMVVTGMHLSPTLATTLTTTQLLYELAPDVKETIGAQFTAMRHRANNWTYKYASIKPFL